MEVEGKERNTKKKRERERVEKKKERERTNDGTRKSGILYIHM